MRTLRFVEENHRCLRQILSNYPISLGKTKVRLGRAELPKVVVEGGTIRLIAAKKRKLRIKKEVCIF